MGGSKRSSSWDAGATPRDANDGAEEWDDALTRDCVCSSSSARSCDYWYRHFFCCFLLGNEREKTVVVVPRTPLTWRDEAPPSVSSLAAVLCDEYPNYADLRNSDVGTQQRC